MIYRLTCGCGTAFKVDERAIDRFVRCAHCARRFLIEAEMLQPVETYRLTCECGAKYRVEEKEVGGSFQCARCDRTVHVTRDRLSAAGSEYDRVSHRPPPTLPVQFDGHDANADDSAESSAHEGRESLEKSSGGSL
ncbi:MAG: hypothetical protein ACOC46_03960 [Pirellulales bacterium]